MTHSKLLTLCLWWLALLATGMAVSFLAAGAARAAVSEGIDATCPITAGDGSHGTGRFFEISHGYVYAKGQGTKGRPPPNCGHLIFVIH